MTGARFTNPIFAALDTPDLGKALEIGRAIKPYVGGLKVGLEFITAQGPQGIRAIIDLGLPVFADTKFHDIPNTVGGASRAISALDIAIFNVHVSGGAAMMRAAVEAAQAAPARPKVLGVTVLTSMNDDDLVQVRQQGPLPAQVKHLANIAQASGLDGVVCSPREIALVRAACGPDFLIVTPGVRPAGAAIGDQRRVMTPAEAVAAGADILVIGRPITAAANPGDAAKAIAAEIVAPAGA
jgi:orotidine-5'-phosphate decarboxylase